MVSKTQTPFHFGPTKNFPAPQFLHLLGLTRECFFYNYKSSEKAIKGHKKPRGNANIIFFPRMIKLCKSPIYKAKLTLLVVNHYIMWLYIPMHDSLRVAIIQCLSENIIFQVESNKQLEKIKSQKYNN